VVRAERPPTTLTGTTGVWVVLTLAAILMCFEMVRSGAVAIAADESRVNAATGHVETGARKIGQGKIGEGVEETAKGIGHTVVEGAKFSGQKVQEAGKAAEPQARGAGERVRDGAVSFGQSVKTFFTRLFTN
jgi:hypothetical protein